MKTTVIFDMDGVIVDTEPVHHFAYRQHFDQLGIDVSDDMYASFTGGSTKNIYERIKSYFGLMHDTQQLVEAKRNLFNDAFDKKEDLKLLDGVEKLIGDLHAGGFQLILASSSAKVTIDRVFGRFGLHRYFSHIVSGEDFPRSKPDPAIFLEAVRLSGDDVSECIVIEDSTNGVKAAKAAGIFTIGYVSANSKKQDLSMADKVVRHFSELTPDAIKQLP